MKTKHAAQYKVLSPSVPSSPPCQPAATRTAPGIAPLGSVLLITSDFPPLAGTNTQRVQSFVRHLPAFGWAPIVVTRATADMPCIDSSAVTTAEESSNLVRVTSPDPFKWWSRRAGRRADVAAPAAGPTSTAATQRSGLLNTFRPLLVGLSRAAHRFLHDFAYIPDSEMPWAARAAARAIKLARMRNVGALLTSCPSYSSHVAGLRVKRATGLPWVADFRDLWIDRPYRERGGARRRRKEARLEAAVVKESDVIVIASPRWAATFERKYGAAVRDKIVVITNGYEGERRTPANAARPAGPLRLVYTGAMYPQLSPAPLLQALERLLADKPHLSDRVRVDLAGYGDEEVQRLQSFCRASNLRDVVDFKGTAPHAEAIILQDSADVLLLFSAQGHADTISGKLFEYMATGKPVLALVPPHGIQAELLASAGTGLVVDYDDVAAVRVALERLIEGPGRQADPNWSYIEQFSRRRLTGALAAELDRAACRSAAQ
jgi:glycosyltransferase involved in cell wall biosynthesis